MSTELEQCRLCKAREFEEVIDLGSHVLSGVFPRSMSEVVSSGSLRLLRCSSSGGCGLLQLEQSFSPDEMYGDNYGYRSGLNPSMVRHLQAKVRAVEASVELTDGDLVIDIGSNDGTTLAAYSLGGRLRRVGVDPSGEKFRHFYPEGAELLPEFFSAAAVAEHLRDERARVVTSFSMLYDLEDPLGFAQDVSEVLVDGGVWVFEQSYMPTMLEANSYDTICHEHLEYYGLRQIVWILDRAGMTISDIEFNDINGGSFSVAAKKGGTAHASIAQEVLDREKALCLDSSGPYDAFTDRVRTLRTDLCQFLDSAAERGQRVAGLGASTKGNTLLQYCDIGPDRLQCIGEVNRDKFGCVTPGSGIPIVPEEQVLAEGYDFLLVLPWHFRAFFLDNPRFAGQTLLFPLPSLETVRL